MNRFSGSEVRNCSMLHASPPLPVWYVKVELPANVVNNMIKPTTLNPVTAVTIHRSLHSFPSICSGRNFRGKSAIAAPSNWLGSRNCSE